MHSLRADWEIARRGYARYAAYPAATIAGVFTNTVFGFVRAFILLALYEQRGVVGGYDPSAVVTYVWLGQALLMTIYAWGWQDIALRIRSGDIATDLIRPMQPVLASTVSFGFRALYNAVAFWSLDIRGTMTLAGIAINVFSGFLVPISFFPDWLAAIARSEEHTSELQ